MYQCNLKRKCKSNKNNSLKSAYRPGNMKKKKLDIPMTQYEDSSCLSRKRLTIRRGIFQKGKSSGSVFRGIDGPISKQTIARAEENLSLLFERSSPETNKIGQNTSFENALPVHPSPNVDGSEEVVKRSTNARKQFRRYGHKDRPGPTNDDKENAPSCSHGGHKPSLSERKEEKLWTPCSRINQWLKADDSGASDAEKTRTPVENTGKSKLRSAFHEDGRSPVKRVKARRDYVKAGPKRSKNFEVSYDRFAKWTKASLTEAYRNVSKDCDLTSELQTVLQDTLDSCSWLYTPPSGIKGIEQYLRELNTSGNSSNKGSSNPLLRKRKLSESTITSSSALTPDFEPVTKPLTLIMSPRGLIERYEKKREDFPDTNSDDGSHISPVNKLTKQMPSHPNSQLPVKAAPLSSNESRTPLASLENIQTAPKTLIVNPLNYFERYERVCNVSSMHSENRQRSRFHVDGVTETGEGRPSTSSFNVSENFRLFAPYHTDNRKRGGMEQAGESRLSGSSWFTVPENYRHFAPCRTEYENVSQYENNQHASQYENNQRASQYANNQGASQYENNHNQQASQYLNSQRASQFVNNQRASQTGNNRRASQYENIQRSSQYGYNQRSSQHENSQHALYERNQPLQYENNQSASLYDNNQRVSPPEHSERPVNDFFARIPQSPMHLPRPEQMCYRGTPFLNMHSQYQLPRPSLGHGNTLSDRGQQQPFRAGSHLPSTTQLPVTYTIPNTSPVIYSPPLETRAHLSLNRHDEENALLRRTQPIAATMPQDTFVFAFRGSEEESLHDRNSHVEAAAFYSGHPLRSRTRSFPSEELGAPSTRRDENSNRFQSYFG